MTRAGLKRTGRAATPEADRIGRSDLKSAWQEAFGSPPPAYLSLRFMCRALAYDARCKATGGLSPDLRRSLRTIAAGRASPASASGPLKPGANLVREWNGRIYQVEVVEGGFRFDGRTYRSLTAIARRITGTNWSGPRFFGLT